MKKLTPDDYLQAAQLLACPVAAIRAVAAVESSGDGFHEDGRPKILFEAHIFSRLTGHRFDASHPEISSFTWNKALYVGGEGEHVRLETAAKLDREAALQACSWGKFQLMGFNYRRCGFALLQDFINAMYLGELQHLLAFCNFVRSMGLDDELRARDWAGFARGFNGPKFAENNYDTRLGKAFAQFQSIESLVARS